MSAPSTPTSSPAITLPPYAALLGICIDAQHRANGSANGDAPVLRMDFSDALAGRPGHLHGGAIAGLLDMAAHAALAANQIAVGQPIRFKQIGITIDFVRGGKELPTYARGRVTKLGKRVATVVVEAWQDEERTQIAAARLHMLMRGEDGEA